MYGAILGDIIGSVYEFEGIKTKDFELFPKGCDVTDDTIMTIAVARALMQWKQEGGQLRLYMIRNMKMLGRCFPNPLGAYGNRFYRWLMSREEEPYFSCGNGSAMRASPCGLLASTMEEAMAWAKISAEVTHNHPEGILGAQAVAAAVFLAKTGHSREKIREYIHLHFYPMDRTLDQIRVNYRFEPTCQKSVPESIIAFLESNSFEDAIRNTVSLGGDADTMGAITGAIAWSYYRFREESGMDAKMHRLREKAKSYMPPDFIETADQFEQMCFGGFTC